MKQITLAALLLLTITVAKGQTHPEECIRDSAKWHILSPTGRFCEVNAWGKCYYFTDTIPLTFEAQYCRNCAITWRDGYLINGKPFVIVKSRLVAVNWYRWRVKDNLITNKNKQIDENSLKTNWKMVHGIDSIFNNNK